jgi:poly-gamma-glutamate system protein
MYRPSLKSIWTLLVLSLSAYALYFWAENSHIEVQQPHFKEKMAAANLMQKSMDVLRDARAPGLAFVDEINDPDQTLLLGQKYTLISSVPGDHQAKLSTINPNMAAMMVQLLNDAGLRSGDPVAVCVSGSFPGLNLALYSACKVLDLEPVIITSVSSSWYGATDPDFTWLDMERVLREAKLLPFHSLAASTGGADDRGRSLSPEGRKLIRECILRNGVDFVHAKTVQESVDTRVGLFLDQIKDSPRGYAAFVNIGGGVASIGHPENGRLIPVGMSPRLKEMNYPGRGVIHYFSDAGIPLINFKYYKRSYESLMRRFGMPLRLSTVPDVGEGKIFTTERYDLRVTLIAVVIMMILVGLVIRFDIRMQRLDALMAKSPEELL